MKTILITGASSGIGLQSACSLGRLGHHLILTCRSEQRAHQTNLALTQAGIDGRKLRILVMDQADLTSVDRCCMTIMNSDDVISHIILNTGMQYAGLKKPLFSNQGYELTFAVNHLSHQLILMRLMSLWTKDHDLRVIITASDVHNPSSGGGRVGRAAGLGTMQGLRTTDSEPMVDGTTPFDPDKAYKDSKLCNVLLAKQLSTRLKTINPRIPVIAWSPGLVIPRSGEGFFRTSRQQNPLGMMLFAFFARDLLRVTESLKTAGQLLVDLTLDDKYNCAGFRYYSNQLVRPGLHQFEEISPSDEALDDSKARDLWDLCENLIEHSLNQRLETPFLENPSQEVSEKAAD
ncbi:SDR family NAD(P)-dependent oxidoreductase [Synechococcus sp. MIT S1220]|uniref:SDR family NAD(P)-dependent oxidoreductase n=1 Tax=Synechococcus sp. MIT S1220 TaxID=3082549 RepID=UPI0039B126C9